MGSFEIFLGCIILMFTLSGISEEKKDTVTIKAIKGTIEVEKSNSEKIILQEGEEIIVEGCNEEIIYE